MILGTLKVELIALCIHIRMAYLGLLLQVMKERVQNN